MWVNYVFTGGDGRRSTQGDSMMCQRSHPIHEHVVAELTQAHSELQCALDRIDSLFTHDSERTALLDAIGEQRFGALSATRTHLSMQTMQVLGAQCDAEAFEPPKITLIRAAAGHVHGVPKAAIDGIASELLFEHGSDSLPTSIVDNAASDLLTAWHPGMRDSIDVPDAQRADVVRAICVAINALVSAGAAA